MTGPHTGSQQTGADDEQDKGPVFCARGCRYVEMGLVCSDRPGVVRPCGGSSVYLCPPETGCVCGAVHRIRGGDWHTCTAMSVAEWFARAESLLGPHQLELPLAGAR